MQGISVPKFKDTKYLAWTGGGGGARDVLQNDPQLIVRRSCIEVFLKLVLPYSGKS